jgi:rRNA maturation endonuclease Nob1
MSPQVSDLTNKIEKTIVEYMKAATAQLKKRAGYYSVVQEQSRVHRKNEQVEKILVTYDNGDKLDDDIAETLEGLKQKGVTDLNEVKKAEEKLEEKLTLPVVFNHINGKIDVILPFEYEKINEIGLEKEVYNEIAEAAGTSETYSYKGMTVIRTSSRNRNKIAETLENISENENISRANIEFYQPDERKESLGLEETTSTNLREVKKVEKPYRTSDIRNELGYKSSQSVRNAIEAYEQENDYSFERKGRAYIFSEQEKDALIEFANEIGYGKKRNKKSRKRKKKKRKTRKRKRKYPIPEKIKEGIRQDLRNGMLRKNIFDKYKENYRGPDRSLIGTINVLNAAYQRSKEK